MDTEAYEQWIAYLLWQHGGSITPLSAHRNAKESARHGKPRRDFRYLPDFKNFRERVREAAAAEETYIDLPGIGRVTWSVAKTIGGFLMLNFMSGFRTYTGAAILMLTGIAAICTAVAGLLGIVQSGDVMQLTSFEWWAAIMAGAGVFGQGLSQLGLGGKADKDMAVQIALAQGQTTVAKAVVAGDIAPNTVTAGGAATKN